MSFILNLDSYTLICFQIETYFANKIFFEENDNEEKKSLNFNKKNILPLYTIQNDPFPNISEDLYSKFPIFIGREGLYILGPLYGVGVY